MSETLSGKRLGRYDLIERIGRGGMAEVYKAHQSSLDRLVAIKVLHPFLSEDPEFKERFQREAHNIARLKHTHIVQVYDFEHDLSRDLYFMVMEFVDGQSLKSVIEAQRKQNKLIPVEESIRIVRDLAKALDYAHEHGMIHRDIKPGNVLIESSTNRVVLTDFGIARLITGPNMTATGSMVGTPAYMSPEQGLGQAGDHRSDIYSLGVLLYQLVTGATPYEADTPIGVVLKHVNEALPPPSERNPDLPEGVERVIYKALAKSPENRYQRVIEMAAHLDNLEVTTTLVLRTPEAPAKPETKVLEVPEVEDGRLSADSPTEQPMVVPTRGIGCLNFLIVILLAAGALAGGIYLAYTGALADYLPISLDSTDILTATPVIPQAVPPGFEDAQATEVSRAIDDLAAGREESPPRLVQGEECTFDYDVLSLAPESRSSILEGDDVEQRIVLVNAGTCAFGPGAQLVFVEASTDAYQGPDRVNIAGELEPGEATEVVIEFQAPAFSQDADVYTLTWAVELRSKDQLEPPLRLDYTIIEEGS